MNPRLLLRLARLARRRPSERRFWLVVGVIAAVLVLAGVERFIGWPDWLTLDKPAKFRP